METIYTIPVNEAFSATMEDPKIGCPFCLLYRQEQDRELDLILGASMMEPDVRIKTNAQGFCGKHYDKMFVRRNRLGLALMMESHLDELKANLSESGLIRKSALAGAGPLKALEKLEGDCYVCSRMEKNLTAMKEVAVLLWDADPEFQKKVAAQPYFCLPHYRALLDYCKKRLQKKRFLAFYDAISKVEEAYLDTLKGDVSWFCKKFDYRYGEEPWYNSKDAVERSMKFLRSDIHKDEKKK